MFKKARAIPKRVVCNASAARVWAYHGHHTRLRSGGDMATQAGDDHYIYNTKSNCFTCVYIINSFPPTSKGHLFLYSMTPDPP